MCMHALVNTCRKCIDQNVRTLHSPIGLKARPLLMRNCARCAHAWCNHAAIIIMRHPIIIIIIVCMCHSATQTGWQCTNCYWCMCANHDNINAWQTGYCLTLFIHGWGLSSKSFKLAAKRASKMCFSACGPGSTLCHAVTST